MSCDELCFRNTFICWDPSAQSMLTLPVVETPLHSSQVDSALVLHMVDHFMAEAKELVVAITFDAALPHQAMRRLFFGTPKIEDQELMKRDRSLKFFPCLEFEELPPSGLPRLPVKVAHFWGQPYFALPGCCAFDARVSEDVRR